MNFIARVVIILIAVLVGASVGKVAFSDPLPLSLGGGVVAAIAIGVAALFSPRTIKLEKSIPQKQLIGMQIATVGFVVAICGWLVNVFVSQLPGFILAAIGVFTGLVGMAVHFINMFRK